MSDGTKPVPVSGALLRLASDDRLVEQVRAGSERAFEVAYDRHHRGILTFCRHMLRSVEEAEDAVQHTFMAAFGDLERSTKAIQLRPWLYTIARNRCLSVLRARREYPVAEVEPPPTENLSAEVERRQDLRDLLGDVAGLPEDQRAALVLAQLGAVSHEEIAAVLGVPREKVKALVFQARTSLADSRRARETPCTEIREQLANPRGGALRRSPLRRHLLECSGCREFRDDVKAQRRDLALVLPVAPTLALKDAVLGAVFGSGAAGGGGAIAAASGGAFAAKALVALALVGGGTVAGVAAIRVAAKPGRTTHRPAARTPAATNGPVRPAAPPPVSMAAVPMAVVEEERTEARPRRQRTPRRTHRSNSRVQGTDRLRAQPEQRSKPRREEKLHAKSLKRERKAERKLRPARPEKLKRAPNERSARRHSAATPTSKAPRKAKERQPKPVATAAPVAEPTITPDPPEVQSEAHGKPR